MEPAIYPYLKSNIKTTSIASGQYSFSVDDVFQGLVLCKLIVELVSSVAYMGDFRKNLFYFRDYDCSSVGFYVDGQSYPSQPLRPNYEAYQYIDSYRTLTTFRKVVNIDRLYRRLLFLCPGGGSLLLLQYQEKRTMSTGNEICQTLAGHRYLDPVRHLPRNPQYRRLEIRVRTINERPMTCRYPLYIEERHHALGRDATFPWSRALTHPPRCHRTRHRVIRGVLRSSKVNPIEGHGGHLGAMAAILASDVIYSKPAPILLLTSWRYVINVTQASVNKQRYWLELMLLRP